MELAIAALALAGAGFTISSYMTLTHYAHGGTGATCAVEGSACTLVTHTPAGQVFGVPNSLLGMFYYALVLSAAATRIALGQWWMLAGLLGVSILAAGFSLYLAYVLVFRLRVVCVLCFASHMINLTLLGILAVAT